MITTGVTGQEWRASVSPWGAVVPWDEQAATLDWFVAADDRWHVPAEEPTVRQRRIDDVAVVETRVRVPGGDAVQRVWSVADGGGFTVVEIENDSPMPFAVAFSHRGVRTERPIVDLPIEGIDLPAEAFVVPVGHRATVRVALAHTGTATGPIPAGLPTWQQVARGWTGITDRASRLLLPEGETGSALAALVVAQRCELALGAVPHAEDDPAGYAVALGELVRMGERPDAWLPELVEAVERLGPTEGWAADAGLAAAARVLVAADEGRARRDLGRIRSRRRSAPRPAEQPTGALVVPWVEQLLAAEGVLLPVGLPAAWWGSGIEVYGVPVGPATAVSYAVRWHGARPAVLWEVTGEPLALTAPVVDPAWETTAASGEALWPAPTGAPDPAPTGAPDEVRETAPEHSGSTPVTGDDDAISFG
jgi:hypothetical protein